MLLYIVESSAVAGNARAYALSAELLREGLIPQLFLKYNSYHQRQNLNTKSRRLVGIYKITHFLKNKWGD